jgi:hypothetical protein
VAQEGDRQEADNISRLVFEGCIAYYIMTNIAGIAARDLETMDRLRAALDERSDLEQTRGVSTVAAAPQAAITVRPMQINVVAAGMLPSADPFRWLSGQMVLVVVVYAHGASASSIDCDHTGNYSLVAYLGPALVPMGSGTPVRGRVLRPVTNQVTTAPGNRRQGATYSDAVVLVACGNPT